MIKAKASGSKVYLYFMKKGRQARQRNPRNACVEKVREAFAVQKLITFFQQKILTYFKYQRLKF